MSWDIFIQDLPKNIERISDIPDDFIPNNIGKRRKYIEEIKDIIPDANFEDESWGLYDGDDFGICQYRRVYNILCK